MLPIVLVQFILKRGEKESLTQNLTGTTHRQRINTNNSTTTTQRYMMTVNRHRQVIGFRSAVRESRWIDGASFRGIPRLIH